MGGKLDKLATATVSVVKAAEVAALRFWSFFQKVGVGRVSRWLISVKKGSMTHLFGDDDVAR
jgi:hypothetical protein